MISRHLPASSFSAKLIREASASSFSFAFLRTYSSACSVYCTVHVSLVFGYRLLLTLFSYSLGPVTPRSTYLFLSDDHVMRCDQKREIAMRTSRPYSIR